MNRKFIEIDCDLLNLDYVVCVESPRVHSPSNGYMICFVLSKNAPEWFAEKLNAYLFDNIKEAIDFYRTVKAAILDNKEAK